MKISDIQKAPLESFPIDSVLSELPKGPRSVSILRLDKVHPVVSGNKWFKLKWNLQKASDQGYSRLLSCGGPHSNHLHALACAGHALGFKTVAFVRGYEHLPLTPTLLDCQTMGMKLIFVDKKTYLNRYDATWCQEQGKDYGAYWIPEGGNNALGQKGCEEIAHACHGFDEVWSSIGSGCTFSGIAKALSKEVSLRGVMAIKGGQALAHDLIEDLDGELLPTVSIDCDHHLGGFGRCPSHLVELIQRYDRMGLPLDPVYTAKMVAAFEQAWTDGRLDEKKRYVLIHSGGLQGRRGVKALSESVP